MHTICAWCGETLRAEPDTSDRPVSHGICAQCLAKLWNDIGISTKEFLRSLEIPVLLVDQNMVVRDGSPTSAEMTGKKLEEIEGQLGGDVFECANASLPEGCGLTVHCSGCTLRRTVTDTYTTGQSHTRVPATLKVTPDATPEDVAIFVTTEKVGDRVLLRIEKR